MRWLLAFALICGCGDDGPREACTDGETRPCYSGPPGTEGVGRCTAGVETCAGGEFPGICIADVVPIVESCDGVDQDCNGEIDDVDGTGVACTNADGCDGTTACAGAAIACVGPELNECAVCGGPAVTDLGTTCTANNCTGALVCNEAGDGTTCDAPSENACGLCGGPPIVGLGDDCNVACPGIGVCSEDGDAAVCDCNPQPGMCRDNGVFRPVVAPQAGDLVITELMPSPSGDQTKREWFEVLVMADVDLNQLQLDRASDNSAADVLASVDCISVTAGTRLVFARVVAEAENGGLPDVTGTFSFTMLSGSIANPGDVQLIFDGTVIDAVTWTASTSGAAIQLDPDATSAAANDDPAAFCPARTPYGVGDLGTPGVANVECVGANQCLDNGVVRDANVPTVGDLVITEVMPSPLGDDTKQEWFEVEVTADVDLNNLALDRAGDNLAANVLTSVTCLPATAGSRLVFARSADPTENGGLPAVAGTFTFTMVGGSLVSPGDVQLLVGGTLIDAVSWTSSRTAAALQLDLGSIDPVLNDSEANLCDATAPYNATDLGTPGLANAVCPPGPGQCLGSDGFRRAIEPPSVGDVLITEIMPRPAVNNNGGAEWFEITNLGDAFDLNGLGLDRDGDTRAPDIIASQACLRLEPGQFAVFARSNVAATNGGLPAVTATFGMNMVDTNGNVQVVDASSCATSSPFACTVVFDQLPWASSTSGVSAQLKSSQFSTTANDSAANFCAGTAQYGSDGNLGTPGTADAGCP